MKWVLVVLAALLLLAFVVPVSADTIVGTRAATLKGPSGLLIPLGIENVVPLQTAIVWYNWICVIIILPIAAVASKRNFEYYALLLPLVAGLLTMFGWFNTGNIPQQVGVIIFFAVVAVGLIMKKSLRENFGLGGPGSTFMNIAIFMIVLSAVVGMVNSSAIWQDNTGVASNQYLNADVSQEIVQLNNAGGVLDDIINTGNALLNAGYAAVKVLLSTVLSVAVISAALVLIFPFLASSPMALALLLIFQAMMWVLEARFISDYLYSRSIYALEY